MSQIFLAFGSNLGNRRQNIFNAINLLACQGVELIKLSTIIETNPVGGPPQGKYLNAVARVETSLSPYELLQVAQQIEKDLGRVKKEKNGPRPIDIDILLYNNVHIQSDELIIPHPRMKEREFVMRPLKEISEKDFYERL